MTQDRNFHQSWQKDGGKVGENPAALRAAVFLLSAKNRRGVFKQPPSRAKVKLYAKLELSGRGHGEQLKTTSHCHGIAHLYSEMLASFIK